MRPCSKGCGVGRKFAFVAGPAAAAALIGGALAGMAGADDGGHRRNGGQVVAQVSQSGVSSEPTCTTSRDQCIAFRASSTTLNGGLQGTANGRVGAWVAVESGASVLAGVQLFTGSVEGCGTGSFAWTVVGELTDSPTFESQLRIIDGSGSGELTGISGRGSASLTGDGPVSGTISFRVRCRS